MTSEEQGIVGVDGQFFDALLVSSTVALESLLAEEFILIDVFGGSEISKSMLISALDAEMIRFDQIEPAEVRATNYGAVGVVRGRTRMDGQAQGAPFEVQSRYVHVYAKHEGQWKMVSAQGTKIA